MQKVQAYLKMIVSTQSFQLPNVNKKTPYHWEDCQLTVIKTSGSDEINCPDNHLHHVIHFQRLATQCLLVRNTVKCPKFMSATYNLYFLSNFCRNTCFFRDHWWRAICSNTYSTGPVYSHPVQYSNERVENIISCYGIDHRHQSQELLSDKQSLINATNEYGLLCNVRNVRAFIERNRKHNKRFDFFLQLAV